jgi:hypothetical protein
LYHSSRQFNCTLFSRDSHILGAQLMVSAKLPVVQEQGVPRSVIQ